MDVNAQQSVPSSADPRLDPRPPARPCSARAASIAPFVLLASTLALGALVQATPDSATLFGVAGPGCPSTHLIGPVGCPGCGLTRGTALLLDGNFAAATRLQPAAWLVVAFAAAGALIHGGVLVTGRTSAWTAGLLRSGRVTFTAGLLLAWLARLV